MRNYFIYQYNFDEHYEGGKVREVSSTVIFCEAEEIRISTLQAEINQFYETHTQTEKIFVFGGEYIRTQMVHAFIEKQEETFRYVPTSDLKHLKDNIHLYSFDEFGDISPLNSPYGGQRIFNAMYNQGMTKLFIDRGGVIESKDAHHFVFPSGKHSNKFLRTGNILLYSSEIYFLAFRLLPCFREKYNQIYCDTSSINSVAFALQDLKRRILFTKSQRYLMLPVESFSSYDGIYKGNAAHMANSLIIISASTSARILDRIIRAHPLVRKSNMQILYFLGTEESYKDNEEQIVCNLTKGKDNPNGIEVYPTFMESSCELCDRGSFAVNINGDVFLSESPRIKRVTFGKSDAPKFLSPFVQQFMSHSEKNNNVIKVNYKETTASSLRYEIYLDVHAVISHIENGGNLYSEFKAKLNDFINQFIPANTRYIIKLPDEGSTELAHYIIQQIGNRFSEGRPPAIIDQGQCDTIPESEFGSAVIVASCIANGKNLLFLSRALRRCKGLRLIYFIGVLRMSDEQTLDFLRSNLKQGVYGKETNSFHSVENIFCNNDVRNTSWLVEIEFLKRLREFTEDLTDFSNELTFIDTRISLLEASQSVDVKGLANSLFYHSVFDLKELTLNKNYAFLEFDNYYGNLSQADVYFTISIILNNLRLNAKAKNYIKQSEYIRTLLDPGNFTRFNDGVIQSSILRAANSQELAYHVDEEASAEISGILQTIITYQGSDQGEALLEFLYAIANNKLSMKRHHLLILCNSLKERMPNRLALLFGKYIESTILK